MDDPFAQTFGSYRCEALLDSGVTGNLYAARHIRLTNRVATLRLLPAALNDDPTFPGRVETVLPAAAALEHPGLLTIWEYGRQGDWTYIAGPLLSGNTLADLVARQGPRPLTEAIDLLTPLAQALDYAHQQGVIHGDVRPENIQISDDGRAALGEIGVAATLGAEYLARVRPGDPAALAALAPELVRGEEATPATDLYGLGATLYTLLNGQPPYPGNSAQEIGARQQAGPPPLLSANLPGAVSPILDRALAYDPAARYPSGAALLSALAALRDSATANQATTVLPVIEPPLDAPPLDTAPPPLPLRTPTRERQSLLPIAIAVGLFIALILAIGLVAALSRRATATPTATLIAIVPSVVTPTLPPTATIPPTVTPTITPNVQATVAAAASATNVSVNQTATAAIQAGAATATARAALTPTLTPTFPPTVPVPQTAPVPITPPAPPPTAPPPTSTPAPPTPTPPLASWGPVLPPLAGGKPYSDPEGRFTLSLPPDWQQVNTPGFAATFTAPGNAAQFLVGLLPIPATMSLTDYDAMLESQLRSQPGYQSISVDRVVVGNERAIKRVYRVTRDGQTVQIAQVYLVRNGVAHNLGCVSAPDTFTRFASACDGIAGSYQVTR